MGKTPWDVDTRGATEAWSVAMQEQAGETKDPVCGMSVDTATAKHSTEYAGKTYYFCAPGCRKAFDEAPETYLAPGYRPSM